MFAAEQTGGHNEYLTPSLDYLFPSFLLSYPCPTRLVYRTVLQNGLKGQSVFMLLLSTTDWTVHIPHRLELSEIRREWRCQKSRLEVFCEKCPHFLWPTSLWRFWVPVRDAIKASVADVWRSFLSVRKCFGLWVNLLLLPFSFNVLFGGVCYGSVSHQ